MQLPKIQHQKKRLPIMPIYEFYPYFLFIYGLMISTVSLNSCNLNIFAKEI